MDGRDGRDGGRQLLCQRESVRSGKLVKNKHCSCCFLVPQETLGPIRGSCSFSVYLCIWVVKSQSPPEFPHTVFVTPVGDIEEKGLNVDTLDIEYE